MIYLYIKTHNVTGLKYFGKTTRNNPYKYSGSGRYWLNHLNVHGYDISTEIVATFEDIEEASRYAIEFSQNNNIVQSKEWANLMFETVKDGVLGYNHTEETKEKFSINSKNMWSDPKFKEKIILKHKERWADENLNLKQKQKERLTGIKRPEHSQKLLGRKVSEETKEKMRKPKHSGHGAKVSAATKGKSKSDEHKKSISESRKGKKFKARVVNPVIDHKDIVHENPRRMSIFYNIDKGFYGDIDKPIRYQKTFEKLGIPYTAENRYKTKRELGFRFQEILI